MSRRVPASAQSLVIRNARAFDPGEHLDSICDVLILDGRIVRVGPSLEAPAAQQVREVDGTGLWLLPAFTDLCAHLGEPGEEYKEDIVSGLASAAQGGFGTVCCLPDTHPVNDSAELTAWMIQQSQSSAVRLAPIAAATVALHGEELTEMLALKQAGAVAVGTGSRSIVSAAVMRRVQEYASDLDLPVFHHTDDASLSHHTEASEGAVSARLGLRGSPALAEQLVVERDLAIARFSGARYHAMRLSTVPAVQAVAKARSDGIRVSCAVPIHNLVLSEDDLCQFDTNRRLLPPLRSPRERAELCSLLEQGAIDAVVSNHRAQAASDKACDFSSAQPGSIGLSTCWSLLLSLVQQGDLSLGAAVRALTSGPAAVLSVPAARISEGAPANLTLIDPDARWRVEARTLGSKSNNSAVLGRVLPGRVRLTLCDGHVAFEHQPESDDYAQH